MKQVTPKDLQMISHVMCTALNIDMQDDDIVLYIGADDATSNIEAIVQWIEEQEAIPSGSRMEIALALRDRLADVLFEIESAIRVSR